MSKKKDGGQAFPSAAGVTFIPGMSWLDYAAIQIAGSVTHEKDLWRDLDHLAHDCYNIAEALLEEKRRREDL